MQQRKWKVFWVPAITWRMHTNSFEVCFCTPSNVSFPEGFSLLEPMFQEGFWCFPICQVLDMGSLYVNNPSIRDEWSCWKSGTQNERRDVCCIVATQAWDDIWWSDTFLQSFQDLLADGKNTAWKTIWRAIQRANNSFWSNGWMSSDFSERPNKEFVNLESGILWYYSWLWVDRAGNCGKGDILICRFGRFGKVGCFGNLSSKNQRERSIDDHKKDDEFKFPVADGTAKLSGRDNELRGSISKAGAEQKEKNSATNFYSESGYHPTTPRRWSRMHEILWEISWKLVGSEDLSGEFQGTSEGCQAAETKKKLKSWMISGRLNETSFIFHVEPWVQFYVPQEELFSIPPHKFFDGDQSNFLNTLRNSTGKLRHNAPETHALSPSLQGLSIAQHIKWWLRMIGMQNARLVAGLRFSQLTREGHRPRMTTDRPLHRQAPPIWPFLGCDQLRIRALFHPLGGHQRRAIHVSRAWACRPVAV